MNTTTQSSEQEDGPLTLQPYRGTYQMVTATPPVQCGEERGAVVRLAQLVWTDIDGQHMLVLENAVAEVWQEIREEYSSTGDDMVVALVNGEVFGRYASLAEAKDAVELELGQAEEQATVLVEQTPAQRLGYTADDLSGMARSMLESLCQTSGIRYPLGASRAKLASLLTA